MRGKKPIIVVSMAAVMMIGGLAGCGAEQDTQVSVPSIIAEDIANMAGGDGTDPATEANVSDDSISGTESENIQSQNGEENQEEETSNIVTILISAAGDVTLGTHQEQDYSYSFRQMYDEQADDSYFFQNVYPYFSEDDFTLVNLEGPLTLAEEMKEGQTYCIKGDPEYVNILTAGSVEAVGLGNNHSMDYLEKGFTDTVETLEDAGIVYAYDKNVGIYETKGIRIGYVSVSKLAWGYSGLEKMIQDGIAKLREEKADLILVSCHWGIERQYELDEYQQQLGRKCIDWGADLVIGHHPHVLQGIEEYQGKFIVYSLGNFCFGGNRNPEDKDTMIFQQKFTFVDGVKQEDKDIRVIPCSVSSVSYRNDYCPTPAEGEEAQRILDKINSMSENLGVQLTEQGYLQNAQ